MMPLAAAEEMFSHGHYKPTLGRSRNPDVIL